MHRILQLAISFILPFRGVAEGTHDSQIIQVSVLASGTVLLNGQTATVSEVKRALDRVQARKLNVWFYRESGKGDPPAEAIDLFKFMVENQLSISLSSQADFSDYLDEEGLFQPRKF
jgi:hypothetical protein